MLSTLIERIRSGHMVEPEGVVDYFERGDSALELRVQLRDYEYPHVLERWRIYCAAFREFRIVLRSRGSSPRSPHPTLLFGSSWIVTSNCSSLEQLRYQSGLSSFFGKSINESREPGCLSSGI